VGVCRITDRNVCATLRHFHLRWWRVRAPCGTDPKVKRLYKPATVVVKFHIMNRRGNIWLILTLVLGLVIGVAGGYFAQAKLRAPKKPVATAHKKAESRKYNAPASTDVERIRQIMSYLSSNIGPRPEGKAQEKQAASFLVTEFEKAGYKVGMDQFALSGGQTSTNLVTADPGGTSEFTFFICAHMDSKSGAPGANDNASGCAAVLELARTIKGTRHFPEVRFLIFGAEEENSAGTARHGSRYYLGTQPPVERAKILGVLSIDTIGVGPEMTFRDWGSRSAPLADALVQYTKSKGLNGTRLQGNKSDHEPFGEIGIPAVWLERMASGGKSDNSIHSSGDAMNHVFVNLVAETVDVVKDYLLGLDEAACRKMAAASKVPVP